MRTRALAAALATALLALAKWSPAGEAGGGPAEELPEIVVTATRTQTLLSETVGAVDVVRPDDAPVGTGGVADLVSTVPGVDAQGTFPGEKTTLNVRGLQGSYGTQRTLVLADGVPLNDGYLGDADLRLVGPGLFERVEVVRGPGSALYGTSALGGVVNLIPRRAGDRPEAEVSVFGGDWGTLGAAARGGAREGAFDWYVSAETLRTDGYIKNPDDGTPRDWDSRSFGARAGWALGGGHEIGFMAQYATGEGQRESFDEDLARGTYSLSYRFEPPMREGAVFTARAYRTTVDEQLVWKFLASGASDHDLVTDGLQLQQEVVAGGRHRLVFGGEVLADDVDTVDPIPDDPWQAQVVAQSTASAAFVQDEVDLGDWRVVLGGRLDYEDAFGLEASPRVGVVRKLGEKDKLYASVGKAYRAPGASDLYMPLIDYGGTEYEGNPDLEPEEHWAVEIGGAHGLGDRTRLEWSAYYDIGLDAWDYMEDLDLVNRPHNITRQKTLGAELRCSVDLGRGASLGAGYAFVRATYDEFGPDPTIEGNLVEDIPAHSGSVSLAKEWGAGPLLGGAPSPAGEGGKAELLLRFAGPRFTDPDNTAAGELDGFAVLDAQCVLPLGKGFALTLALRNVFDTDYAVNMWTVISGPPPFQEPFPQPGRSFYGGVRARF